MRSEKSVEKTLSGLSHLVQAASETWLNPRVKVNSTLALSFQHEPWCEMEEMPNVSYALPRKNKDQQRDFYNYLNQKVTTL